MFTKFLAQTLLTIVPNKCAATVSLTPDAPATVVVVNISNAWLKPIDVSLQVYGGVNLQGDETLIKIPDNELNPTSDGREIRPRDKIVVGDDTFIVKSARLMTLRTVWECVARKVQSA